VSSARRCAPACAALLGTFALMCAGPMLALGRSSDADAAGASAAATATIGQASGALPLSRTDKSDKVDKVDERHGRRPFTQPPGHRGTPARDVAPGHVRAEAPPSLVEDPPSVPSGAVLGATPGSVNGPRVPPRGVVPQISNAASRGALPGIGSDAQPPLSAAITNGPRSAVALGGALGVSAAFNPAYGELATPATQNALAAGLLLMVLGAQAIAGALLLAAARDMLGSVGPPPG
jgi:hypothetical protein